MNIIITMAGEGARFRKAGFSILKHMIEVKGKSLFEWALSSLSNFFGETFIFITRKSYNSTAFIREQCKASGVQNIFIKEIDFTTKGQAATALEAGECIKNINDDVAIYNIDTYVAPDELAPEYIKGDGWVPAFKVDGDRWSFVKFTEDLKVTEITEKIRISEYGTIGFYYFKSFALFKRCYASYRFKGYKEEYIAPLYNEIIRDRSLELYTHIVDKNSVHVIGTPEDVTIFWPEFKDVVKKAGE